MTRYTPYARVACREILGEVAGIVSAGFMAVGL